MKHPNPRIAEIEERTKAPTPGPWLARSHGAGQWDTPTLETREGGILARFTHYYPMKEDAVFVAAARMDIPYLLSLLREAEAALEWYAKGGDERDDTPGTISEFGCGCCAGTYDKNGIVDCNTDIQGHRARQALKKIRGEK